MMSAKVKKFNKYQIGQGRNFVITNVNLYNFNVKKLRRTIGLENLLGVTKNMQKSSKEFVIHVDHEPDYRVTCEQRDDFINALKVAFISIKRDNLKIFGI